MPQFVSVIVPNYNHSLFLKQRIDSILNQSYQNFELILLDDCSSDNSVDIMDTYADNPHVSCVVINDHNSGSPFYQWNKGIQLAKGDWIWIAESDDWAQPDFLQSCMGALSAHPSVGAIVSPVTYYDGNRYWLDTTLSDGNADKYYNGKQFINQFLSVECLLPNVSAMLFRADLLRQVRFDDCVRMKLCGDWHFYIRILQLTDICVLKDSLSFFRRYPATTSMKQETLGMGMIEGAEILSYLLSRQLIVGNYKIAWAKKWWRNQHIYHYSESINQAIRNAFRQHNLKQIIYYYKFYTIVKNIKSALKK